MLPALRPTGRSQLSGSAFRLMPQPIVEGITPSYYVGKDYAVAVSETARLKAPARGSKHSVLVNGHARSSVVPASITTIYDLPKEEDKLEGGGML